jgi:hypothetical protein
MRKVLKKISIGIYVLCVVLIIVFGEMIIRNNIESNRINEAETQKCIDIISNMQDEEALTDEYSITKMKKYPEAKIKDNESLMLVEAYNSNVDNKFAVFVVNNDSHEVFPFKKKGYLTSNYFIKENFYFMVLVLALIVFNEFLSKYAISMKGNRKNGHIFEESFIGILLLILFMIASLPGYMISVPAWLLLGGYVIIMLGFSILVVNQEIEFD